MALDTGSFFQVQVCPLANTRVTILRSVVGPEAFSSRAIGLAVLDGAGPETGTLTSFTEGRLSV